MQKTKIYFIILIVLSFSILGCFSTPVVPDAFYTGDETKTATMFFNNYDTNVRNVSSQLQLRLIDVDGIEFPPDNSKKPTNKPILLPVDKPLNIKVHIKDDGWRKGWGKSKIPYLDLTAIINKEVVFQCPPLEEGKKYTLVYNYSIVGKTLRLYLPGGLNGIDVHKQNI
ncbi:MAG: hypothetical protein FWB86_07115 [Treponema sp.]|nr:hypothetical protein [Treponema sp.]MCL2251994.1 hypothetical protein [Treponema sp.]